MHFIGADLHKQTIRFHVVDQARRKIAAQTLTCSDPARIREWLAAFRPFKLVVEATASYEWFVQLIEPLADRIVLAHPTKLRVIAESTRKSDKLDAQVLAEFLALDMIPEAHRPTPRQRQHRALVRQRYYLRKRTTSVKNRIRRILADYNADFPELFTAETRRARKRFPVKVSAADRFVLNQLWREYDFHIQQIDEVEKALRTFAESASIPEAQARELLHTIPGVGVVTVEAFLSEVGDVRRFRSQKRVAAYAGLAPGQRESAGKTQELNITHRGSRLLRWALNQASWQLVRRDLRWRTIFEGIAKRRGRKKAITAVSRRLLCVMASLVLNGQRYRPAA